MSKRPSDADRVPGVSAPTDCNGVAARPFLGWLLGGFALWLVALSTLYASHAMMCDTGWPYRSIAVALAAMMLVSLALLGCALVRNPLRQQPGSFARQVAGCSLLAAGLTTLLTLAPPLLLTPCATA